MIRADYRCEAHGDFEAVVESPSPDDVPCPECLRRATWVPFPVMGRVKNGEVTRGPVEKAPPGALDTRELGEGMPLSEWRKKREKWKNDERWKLRKELD